MFCGERAFAESFGLESVFFLGRISIGGVMDALNVLFDE